MSEFGSNTADCQDYGSRENTRAQMSDQGYACVN